MIPVISISEGKPAMLLPLTFVIVVSMIKDIFEDNKRHKQDKSENYKKVLTYDSKTETFVTKIWRHLVVGDIV
jgi:magnesium-transporting ATPase (P-type)